MIFLRAHNDHFLCLSNEALANLSARAFARAAPRATFDLAKPKTPLLPDLAISNRAAGIRELLKTACWECMPE